jgi:hypothetical protein
MVGYVVAAREWATIAQPLQAGAMFGHDGASPALTARPLCGKVRAW